MFTFYLSGFGFLQVSFRVLVHLVGSLLPESGWEESILFPSRTTANVAPLPTVRRGVE
jgi:hypothetical protein